MSNFWGAVHGEKSLAGFLFVKDYYVLQVEEGICMMKMKEGESCKQLESGS